MEPRFHTGDLAIVWASGVYHVGQIVAYWSPLLHMVVLHRIVAYHGRLFTFKGDNNSFLDPLKLPASDIKGSLLLHIPRAGALLGWLKEPVHLLVLIIGLLLLSGGGAAAKARTMRLREDPEVSPANTSKEAPTPKASGVTAFASLGVPVALALICSVIAAVGWSRNLVSQGSEPVSYHDQVSFSYHASVARSTVYPTGEVATGQPIFLNLVHAIDVTAHFSFATKAPHSPLAGSMAETVTLSNGGGWSRVLQQPPPVKLRSPKTTLNASINLASAAQIVAEVDKATGVPGSTPTIVVTATVVFGGNVLGRPITGRYSPSLTLDLSTYEASLVGQSGASGSTSDPDLRQSKTGSVSKVVFRPASFTVLRHTIRVSAVRWLGDGGVGLSLGWALVALAWGLWRRQDEASLISARYREQLVGVRSSPEDNARPVVDVVGMPALAKVAETYAAMILDHGHDGTHTYYVDGRTTVYRYQPVSRASRQPKRHPSPEDNQQLLPEETQQKAPRRGRLLTWKAQHAPQNVQDEVIIGTELVDAAQTDAEVVAPAPIDADPVQVEPKLSPTVSRSKLAEDFQLRMEAMRREELAARERAARLCVELDQPIPDDDPEANRQLDEVERTALQIKEEARAAAERARAESAREVAAAQARRENIDLQLAELRRAFSVLDEPVIFRSEPVVRASDENGRAVLDMAEHATIPEPTGSVPPEGIAKRFLAAVEGSKR
jgi:hypothetical protein